VKKKRARPAAWTAARPVSLYVPSGYDGQTNIPLVLLLHGYGSEGAQHEAYMQLQPLAESRRFFYCYPNGTVELCAQTLLERHRRGLRLLEHRCG